MSATQYTAKNGIVFYENSVSVAASKRPRMVFVHGMGGSASTFRFWFTLCESMSIKAYAIDLRGHGESKCSDLGQLSLRDYADDVSEVITSEIGDCVLIGWSLGARVARLVAAENERVKKLVLVTSPDFGGRLPSRKVLLKMLKLRYLWAMLWRKPFQVTKKDAEDLIFNFDSCHTQEQKQFVEELGCESGLAAREMVFGGNSDKLVPCHVLVVAAERDEMTPVSIQREIQKNTVRTSSRLMGPRTPSCFSPTFGTKHSKKSSNGLRPIRSVQII